MMRSRKGDAFLLILDFLFLVAIITLFITIAMEFRKENPDEPLGVHQAAMLRTYASADAFLLSLDVIAKREALVAIRDVARSGATIITDTRCGTYAGLERWNSPDGKTCFPAQKVYDALKSKLQDRLRISAQPSMPYELALTSEGDTLRIGGTGTRDITLPILLTTGGDQRAASSLLSQNTVPSTTAFSPDTRLDATVRPIPGGTPRSSPRASAIIIHATRTSTAADALAQYDGGSLGAHYLIDEDGHLTQLVREDLRVRHLVACDTAGACAIDGLEDTSIAIAIVAPQELPLQGETCPEGIEKRAPISWCDTQGYPAPANGCAEIGGPVCVASASQAQRDTLTKLVADIARRRDIPVRADTVFLEEQVSPSSALATLALVPTNEDPNAWWSRFLALASVTAKTPVAEDTPTAHVSGGAPQLDLPIDGDLRVSSCFGWRTVNGKPDLHDGIDFAGDGNEITAAADGIVYAVCEDGTCDGIPARYSGFGNNIIIAHDGGVYTRYSHLSAIKVKAKDRVARGQAIGVSGNTGRSFGAHLDFKVYVSEQAIPEVGGAGDKAVEPLCFFPPGAFDKLTFNTGSDSCKQYGSETVAADNERLRATCARFDVQPQPACGIGTAPSSITADDPTIRRTIERLDAMPGLRAQIATSASENGIDELLVLALITQESKGDPNAVSWTGCAGIGQFCKGTAELVAFQEIFGPGLRTCDCPGSGSCTADVAGCVGDPRLDPIKSAQAIPLHLALDAKTFQDYQDRWRFAIASYNAGSPVIRTAIRKSGKSDPTWEEIVPHLRDATGSSTKTEEVVGYVAKVTGYWAALGGDTTPSQIGITCTAVTPTAPLGTQVGVREVGSYTFTPSFSIAVPNGLAPIVGVSATAQAILNTCDGRGGSDPNACFTREERERFGDRIVACAPGNEALLQKFREFVADCRTSGQSGCGCAWDAPELPDGVEEARFDLYGTDARLIIGDATYGTPAGARTTRVAASPYTAPRDAILSIVIERDGERTKTSLVTWRIASGGQEGEDGADDELQVDDVREISTVLLRPDGAWFTNDAPACAPYKREHALCVDLGTTTVLPNGSSAPLVARFALWLKDLEIPTTVADIKAATPTAGGYVAVQFQPSASADISHYRIWCAPSSVGVDETTPYTMTNTTQAVVRHCNGEPIVPGPHTVRVVPYDITGQRGEATEAGTVDESDTGWLGVINGLQDGFTEEEFFNAFVTYYTGGLATTP